MRTLLSIVACLVIILIAGIPSGDARWYLGLLGCAAVLLLRVLSEREQYHERIKDRENASDETIDALISFASSVRRDQERNQDHQG